MACWYSEADLELSAHVLRHTLVTILIRSGADLFLVAELAGHRRLDTTRRYSLPTLADKDAEVERSWSRSDGQGFGCVADKVLSDDELEQLSRWPAEVARSDLVAHLTL